MMRRAVENDLPMIMDFLRARRETSMFALANLVDHGLDGVHHRAVSVWIAPNERGVFCITNDGVMLPQLPHSDDWPSVAEVVRGRAVSGCIGEKSQMHGLLKSCNLTHVEVEVNNDEPLMQLSLKDLKVKDYIGELVPLSRVPLDHIIKWRAAYLSEVLGVTEGAMTRAQTQISQNIAVDSHRCLLVAGQPVAMTGFNARFEDMVQIGGVYTPPQLRGNGYAGAALAQHLAEARGQGATRAVLFAASETACGVYERLGFERCGTYSMCIFKTPQEVI